MLMYVLHSLHYVAKIVLNCIRIELKSSLPYFHKLLLFYLTFWVSVENLKASMQSLSKLFVIKYSHLKNQILHMRNDQYDL